MFDVNMYYGMKLFQNLSVDTPCWMFMMMHTPKLLWVGLMWSNTSSVRMLATEGTRDMISTFLRSVILLHIYMYNLLTIFFLFELYQNPHKCVFVMGVMDPSRLWTLLHVISVIYCIYTAQLYCVFLIRDLILNNCSLSSLFYFRILE
jgi:hypothetical protein